MSRQAFLDQIVVHAMNVPAAAWRQWAGSDAFLAPLRCSLRMIGLSSAECRKRLVAGIDDASWRGLATLDAATRMVASLRAGGAVKASRSHAMVDALMCRDGAGSPAASIPAHYWTVRSTPADDASAETLRLRGVVLIKVKGLRQPATQQPAAGAASDPLPIELAAALAEPPLRPIHELWASLRPDGLLGPAATAIALGLAVAGVIVEAIFLRSALDIGTMLTQPEQRMSAGGVLIAFAAALLGLELVLASASRSMGSRLEARLRIRFLEKIPRLADAYFQSRPIADMLERSHALHIVRMLPHLGMRFLRVGLELAVTVAALAWMNPGAAGIALAAGLTAAAIPLLGHRMLAERDLRARTHAGALTRFHLDALRGRTAIEAHGAMGTIEREHEGLLTEWAGATRSLHRASLAVESVQMLVGIGLVGWMLYHHLGHHGGSGLLLQAYWMLNLPVLGYELALISREYPAYRSMLLRMLEPLGAPDFRMAGPLVARQPEGAHQNKGVTIDARRVAVRATGHSILSDISLQVPAGSHVAIVGSSGAGKSTLLGLLLGWYRPAEGELLVDGHPLTAAAQESLRRRTAWVDPTVQIWNRSLLENVLYGSNDTAAVGAALEMAGLLPVVAKLPQGLATPLGEGGVLLSAGEAQRVRFARALLKPEPRLVVLDEPFVGLERDRRRALLAQARQRWSAQTLLYVTHDVGEARGFDRVIVMDRGRIVEDGDPVQLSQMTASRYRRLLQMQDLAQNRFASSSDWRRIRLEAGRIVTDHGRAAEYSA
jgi:ATP-binding cassette subfamily B protein